MTPIAKVLIASVIFISEATCTQELEALELQCLAANVYFEARGESYEGKLAVALVTLNRSNPSVCDAVYAKGQFSWTKHYSSAPRDESSWLGSETAAKDAYYNTNDFSATHYHNNKVKPKWAKKFKKVTTIGKHTFYEELY